MFELGGASQPDKATQCQLHLKLQAAMSHQVAKRRKIAALDAALTNIFSNFTVIIIIYYFYYSAQLVATYIFIFNKRPNGR